MIYASALPPEILDGIFKRCERRYKYTDPGEERFLPKSRLQPLLLVCKNWHDVAERRLYSNVRLGSDRIVRDRSGQKLEINGKYVCGRFYETVQKNPRIASIVRELHVGSTSAANREESEMHIRLIGICKNLKDFELKGCHADLLDDLAAALAKADLISLQLSYERLGTGEKDGKMLSVSNVLDLLQKLPRLETLCASLARLQAWPTPEAPPQAPLAPCPALKSITVHEPILTAAQISYFMDISPGLEELSIMVGKDCGAALQQGLKARASSLRQLHALRIDLTENTPFPDDAYPIIRWPMIELRELWIAYPLLDPSAMMFLPKLEILNFRGKHSHAEELVQIIQLGVLPNLCEINFDFSCTSYPWARWEINFEDDTIKELRRVCEERDIFFENSSPYEKELEVYYVGSGDSEASESP
ncbi:hypothetical protein SCHPADRAFT_580024 [Schizopora paradoxa]|uniref:Uncharacterized protein n=1 Tax=Schizopora paradoxa TaxID=27342 RepID=A0A0H2RWF2_9AGAM|nr:hypothetical protein SCHPADRAFT_580024 [Schizopora paradoxa]